MHYPHKESIAVLPQQNFTTTKEHNYLCFNNRDIIIILIPLVGFTRILICRLPFRGTKAIVHDIDNN